MLSNERWNPPAPIENGDRDSHAMSAQAGQVSFKEFLRTPPDTSPMARQSAYRAQHFRYLRFPDAWVTNNHHILLWMQECHSTANKPYYYRETMNLNKLSQYVGDSIGILFSWPPSPMRNLFRFP